MNALLEKAALLHGLEESGKSISSTTIQIEPLCPLNIENVDRLRTKAVFLESPELNEWMPALVVADDDGIVLSAAALVCDPSGTVSLLLSSGAEVQLLGGIDAWDLVGFMFALSSKNAASRFTVTMYKTADMRTLPSLEEIDEEFSSRVYTTTGLQWSAKDDVFAGSLADKCFCHCWAFCSKDSAKGNKKSCNAFTCKCHGSCSGQGTC